MLQSMVLSHVQVLHVWKIVNLHNNDSKAHTKLFHLFYFTHHNLYRRMFCRFTKMLHTCCDSRNLNKHIALFVRTCDLHYNTFLYQNLALVDTFITCTWSCVPMKGEETLIPPSAAALRIFSCKLPRVRRVRTRHQLRACTTHVCLFLTILMLTINNICSHQFITPTVSILQAVPSSQLDDWICPPREARNESIIQFNN